MKKLGVLLAASLLVTLVFCAIGCGSGGGGGTGNLSEILGHMKSVKNAYVDIVDTEPGMSPVTSKYWVEYPAEGSMIRMEGLVTEATDIAGETVAAGETQVILWVDTPTTYSMSLYYPAHNKAYYYGYTPTPTSPGTTPEPGLFENNIFAPDLLSYNPTVIDSEKYDGKDCLVVQYTDMGETVKMWIWKDKGLTIKEERTTDQGTSIFEYKNISFSDIPDSKFQLPAGVEKIEIPQ